MGQINLQVPVVGQPNSTEDPKIISDFNTLQTWANGNVDPSNLNPTGGVMHLAGRTVSANTSALVGDLIFTPTAGITITLPAPALNALVGVATSSGGAMSGASPVTVAGTHIYGIGFSNASSFALGTPGSYALLQSDGTNWFIVGGQQDTGWVNLTLSTGMAVHGGDTPAGRLVGDRVWLRGAIDQSAGSASSLATLPASMKPTVATFLPGTIFQSPNYLATFFTVNTSTGVLGSANSGTAPISFYFDGCSYTLS